MKKLLKHMGTGLDGETYDPARVIGYGAAAAGALVFLFNSVWSVIHVSAFDAQSYGVGYAAVLAGVMAVGVGVGAKAKTEPGA